VGWVCQAAGARLSGLEFSVLVPSAIIGGSQEEAARQIAEDWKSSGVDYTLAQVLGSPHFLVGEVDQIAEKLFQNREQFGFSYYVIMDHALEGFAPVVKRLAGI
jgi:hypothetical protein